MEARHTGHQLEPWNKGKLVGQKAPFKLKEIWAIRVRLQMHRRLRELALFNLGIDSKLRACDLVSLRLRDVCHGDHVATRAVVIAAQDSAPGAVRDHAIDARGGRRLDQVCRAESRGLPVSESRAPATASGYAPVRQDRGRLGGGARPRPGSVPDTLDAADEAHANLPADEEPPGGPATAWS